MSGIRLSDLMESTRQSGFEPETGQPPKSMRLSDLIGMQQAQGPDVEAIPTFEVDESKREEWKSQGPIGFMESWRRADKTELLPFNPEGAIKAVGLLRSVQRIQDGQSEPSDIDMVSRYLEGVEEERSRGYSIPGRIGQGTTHLPGFMVEFLASGGLATLGKKAAGAGAKKAATVAIEKGVLRYATRGAQLAGNATIRTALQPHRITEGFAERQIDASLELTDKGVQVAKDVTERPMTSALKSFGDTWIENFSEMTGPGINAAARSVMPTALRNSIVKVWQKLHPGEAVTKLFTAAGFNGFLSEWGEERIGSFLRAVTGVEDFGADNPDRVFDRVIASIPNSDELLIEAGVLAFPGALNMGASQAVAAIRRRKAESNSQEPELRELTDQEAEILALPEQEESETEDGTEFDVLSPDVKTQMNVAGALETAGVAPEAIGDVSESYQAAIEEGQDSGEALQSALNDRGIELTPETKKIIEDAIQATEERQGEALTPISKVDQSERGLIPQFSDKDIRAQAKLLRDRWIDENPGKKIPSLSTFEDTARETMEDFGRDIPTVAKGLKQSVRETSGQIQRNEKIVTERRAFRESLRAQSRAALEGFRAGKSNIQDIKKKISNELKRLPKREQGFLSTVLAQAKTPKDVARAIVRIDQRIEEVQKRDAASQLKRELQRLEASNVVAVDYKQRIRELTKGILLSKPREETIERLVDMREFIDRERAAGKNVDIPSRVLVQLGKLSGKPVSDMSFAEIEDLRSEIKTLANIGKTKLKVRKELDRLRKERDLADIIAGSTPLETSEVTIPIRPGERLSFGQKIKNKLSEIKNFIQNTDIAITPTDAIIDHLDGDAMYQGPNYRIFKSRIDAGFSQYMDLRDEYRSSIADKAEGLRQTNFERIGVYAIAQQDGGLEKLKNNGLTEADVPTLTEKEMEVYQFMREQMDASFPVVADVMKRVHNIEVGQVKGYFPFITNWELMAEETVNDRMLTELIGMKKNVERGFTKSRVGAGDQRVQTDAMDVYLKHMDDVAYLVTLGEDIKYLGELANSPKYVEAVGDAGQKMMREWIDVLARKGGSSGAVTMPILDRLRINLGLATFAFKIGSAAIQLTAIGQGAAQIGNYAFKGAYDVTSRRWRNFVMDNMPELRNRVGDDIAFREFKDQTPIQKLGELGLYPMKALDQIAANSVAIGAYQKYLSDNNLKMDFNSPDQKGIEYAQRIVRRSQSSGLFKDTPLSLTRGKLTGSRSLDRALFQFQSFALTEWSVIRHELWDAGIKKGDISQSAGILFWLLMTATAETALRNGMKQLLSDADDDRGIFDNLWLEILSKVPFVGQIMSSALYDSNPVPVLNFLSSGASGILSALNGKNKGTRKRGAIKVAGSIGRAAGIPGTAQIEQLARKAIPKNKGGTSF